jgi:hypothetical protein
MTLTINMLWHEQRYGLMYKYVWQKEISLEDLPRISLKTPYNQAKASICFLYKGIWKTYTSIKKMILKAKIKWKEQRNRRYRELKNIPKQINMYDTEIA